MSIIVFEDKTRFIPSIKIDVMSTLDTSFIIHNIYDPSIFDYEVHTIPGVKTDMSIFNALKNSNILDTSGFFYRLGGLFSRDYNSDVTVTNVSNILEVFEKYYNFSKTDFTVNANTYESLIPEHTRINKSVSNLTNVYQKYYKNSKKNSNDKIYDPLMPEHKRITKSVNLTNKLLPENNHNVDGFSFENLHTYEKYQNITGDEYNKNGLYKYIIYHNTEEDTIVYFTEKYICDYKEDLFTIFPELKELGEIDVQNEDTLANIIRKHTDKSAVDLWNIIQTECNVLLPPDISPSRDRIESTIHKVYTLNTERKDSISYKIILNRIISELYGKYATPNPMILKMIKRTLPSILRDCGLDKKRMAGGFHWYGMKDKTDKISSSANVPIDTLYEKMKTERENSQSNSS
jgi:hypothetical protein